MRAAIRNQLVIALVAGAVFFTGLGASRLWDNDEPKNAVCAREMMNRGDWIVPTFNGQLRTDKPALLYWLIIGSYHALGVNEFAARLPSALLAVGTCWLVYHLGRMLFRPQVGLWAALIMATNVQFCIAGRWATPDSTLIFCTTLALTAYVWGMARGRNGGFAVAAEWPSPRPSPIRGEGEGKPARLAEFRGLMPQSRLAWAAVCAAMGLAVLAKGPIGLVAPLGAFGLFLLAAGIPLARTAQPEQATLFRMLVTSTKRGLFQMRACCASLPAAIVALRPLLLIAVVAAVAGPWYAAVAIKTDGQWLSAFLWRHNVGRFLEPMEGHNGTLGYHIGMLVICFFPWVFILPPAIAGLAKRIRVEDQHTRSYLLLACWAVVWFALFSISRTKLPNYVLPAYPALAVACGAWLADWIALPRGRFAFRWLSAGWLFLALIGAGVIVAAAVTSRRLLADHTVAGCIGAVAIIGAAIGWHFHRRRQAAAAMAMVVVTMAIAVTLVFTLIAPSISRRQNGPLLEETLAGLSTPAGGLAAFQTRSPSAVFYLGENIDELKNPAEVTQFLASDSRRVLITDEDGLRVISALFPNRVSVIDRQQGFPNKGTMIVIGLAPPDRDEPAAEIAAGPARKWK